MAINLSRIIIHASREKVWDVITNPAKVKLWQYGSVLLTTWEIGTGIRFTTEWEGKVFEQWGKVIAFQPNEMVKYSLFAPRPGLEDKPENYFVMSYVLTRLGEKIQLDIVQEDNRPNAVQEEPQGEENPVMKSLKQLAEAD